MKKITQGYRLIVPVLGILSCISPVNDPPDPADPVPGRRYFDDTIPVAGLDWPTTFSTLPACSTGSLPPFSLPDLPAPTGDIVIRPSASLQPVGVKEKMLMEVHRAGGSTVDGTVHGYLEITAGEGVTVLQCDSMSAGTAEMVVRFDTPGTYTIAVTLATASDTLRGTVAIVAYLSQLPIAEMEIDEQDFRTIRADPYKKIKVPAVFTYDGIRYASEVRLHGGSSRDYPKKSFRFDLAEGGELPDTRDHLILRAEWNDKTILRNYLSLECARNALWLPTPEAEMVHFRINRRYYGVMWRVERIDGDFLRIRGLNSTTASLYEADPETECFTPGGNLSPLSSDDEYRCAYSLQKGQLDYADLIALIEESLQLPDNEFAEKINEAVRVNDMLAYFALMAVIQNHDHVKKNFYLYRDVAAADDRWTVFPWDLELTLGHLWTESGDVLDEHLFTDEPLGFGAVYPPQNILFTRLYNITAYRQRFEEMVDHFLKTVFTEAFINERIDNVLCRATPDILADGNKRADNGEYLARVEEIRTFVKERRSFIKGR
jgi:hypothetical protein